MSTDARVATAATATAEEILRVIYGDDLEGCAVSLDSVAAVIQTALEENLGVAGALAELHEKGFEAVQLLSTPPVDGPSLSADELRSLLGERLDQIQKLATQILTAAASRSENDPPSNSPA